MKWLEVIHLRASQQNAERAIKLLPEHCKILGKTSDLESIEVYQPLDIPTDIVATLTWSNNRTPGQTREGSLMAEFLECFGLIDHKLLHRVFTHTACYTNNLEVINE